MKISSITTINTLNLQWFPILLKNSLYKTLHIIMSGFIWKNRADIYEWLSFGNCFLISSLAQMSKHKIDSSWSVKMDHSHKSWSTNIWNSNHAKKVKKKYLVYRWSDIMNRMQFLVISSPWGNCNKDLTFI